MKKLPVIVFLMVIILIVPPAPLAAENIKVVIDGENYAFDPAPVLIDGRVLVPMRAIFEVCGATVNWEKNTQTAIGNLGGVEIRIAIGSTTPTINGLEKTIDVPSQIINGRTFVPLRFLAEALNNEVSWDNQNNKVMINSMKSFYTLTIDVVGGGRTDPVPGEHKYERGTEVALIATPDWYWLFNYWLLDGKVSWGDTITVVLDSDKSITAYFYSEIA